MYTHNPNHLITVPADVLPPNAARPSADTVMTILVHMFCSKCIWLSMITYHLIGPDDIMKTALQWRHNDHNGISNNRPHSFFLTRLYMRWSKKTPKLHVTGLCEGNSPGPANSLHKGPVTRKMFPIDDVIMGQINLTFIVVCSLMPYREQYEKEW